MKPFRHRKVRPTVKNSREAIKSGIVTLHAPVDLIDDEERKQMLAELADELYSSIDKHFPETDNLEYAILKSHLLIEFVLMRYITCMSFYETDLTSLRYTFAQKLDIAAMLGFGAVCSKSIPSIELLNRIRNQVAHRLEIDRGIFDELHGWWLEDPDFANKASDKERVEFLKWFCEIMAGITIGHLVGASKHLRP